VAATDFYEHHAFAHGTSSKLTPRWDRIAIFVALIIFHGAWIYGLVSLIT
jgi:hypothetical protein